MTATALAFFLNVGVLMQFGLPTGPAPTRERLETLAREIQGKVERMRNQKVRKPLRIGVKSKPEITRFVLRRLEEEYGAKKIDGEGRMLQLFGLIPADMKYGETVTSLLTEQVGGFYDHTRQELYLADWLPEMLQRPVMAHEIFHAVQDQEWGGGKLIDSKKYSHDQVLAHAALLEGDATIVMLNFQNAEVGAPGDVSTSKVTLNLVATGLAMQMGGSEFPVMAAAPDYLKQSLIFPYQQGLLFVGALRQAGWSWERIRGVYDDPPASSEHILHPEKYAGERDHPSSVQIAPLRIPGLERTWDGVAGEFHVRQVLMSQLPLDRSIDGAAGWDGDHLVLLTDGKAQSLAAMTVVWDTPEDAAEAGKMLQETHSKRGSGAPTQLLKVDGSTLYLVLATDAKRAAQAFDKLPAASRVERR
jgi:hypothetical protein